MAVSKKRKKAGKKVKHKGTLTIDPNKESSITLQDLINVLAYQEYVKDGTIVADNAKIHIPEVIPVTIGEGKDKREVGTAVQVPGRDEVSVRLTDNDTIQQLSDPNAKFSIDEENEDGRH